MQRNCVQCSIKRVWRGIKRRVEKIGGRRKKSGSEDQYATERRLGTRSTRTGQRQNSIGKEEAEGCLSFDTEYWNGVKKIKENELQQTGIGQ